MLEPLLGRRFGAFRSLIGLTGTALALLTGCPAAGDGQDDATPDDVNDDSRDDAADDSEEPESEVPGDCKPDFACTPVAPDTGDFYADCVARVNQFRACVCLPPLARKREAEGCLDQQAEFDVEGGAHAGFQNDICEPRGYAQNECPGWRDERHVVEGCLQSMFDEGPPPSERCDGDCYQMHGHHINMTNTDYTEVACGIVTADGQVWSVQNFF